VSRVRLVAVPITVIALQAFGVRTACADPSDATASPAPSETSSSKRSGFEILAVGGYGQSTAKIGDLELQPYGAHVGLDLGFAFASRFRLGWAVGYGFGRTVHQRHDGVLPREDFDFDADTSSLDVAILLGYDVPLDQFLLRYGLGFGGTFMRWDLGGIPPESVFDQIVAESPASGFFLAPSLALLWPHDALLCGVGFEYLVQANGMIPAGFLGKVLVGVKL
jgi:hypothetical protein